MSQVKDQIKNSQAVTFGKAKGGPAALPLVVVPRHYAWMQRSERERKYSQRALEHAAKVLRGEDYVPRAPGERRFTASAIAEPCSRRALFAYAGMPKAPDEVKSKDLMEVGNLWHLVMQMEGLTEGWLDDAEMFQTLDYAGKTLLAKIDGRGGEVGMFELKTKGAWVFRAAQDEPLWKDTMQFELNCWLFGIDVGSIVYINRDTGEMKEHRLIADPVRRRQLEVLLEDLSGWVDLDELPDMLDECTKHDGSVYRRCPYRELCPDARKVSTAGVALRS